MVCHVLFFGRREGFSFKWEKSRPWPAYAARAILFFFLAEAGPLKSASKPSPLARAAPAPEREGFGP